MKGLKRLPGRFGETAPDDTQVKRGKERLAALATMRMKLHDHV